MEDIHVSEIRAVIYVLEDVFEELHLLLFTE